VKVSLSLVLQGQQYMHFNNAYHLRNINAIHKVTCLSGTGGAQNISLQVASALW